MLLCLNKFYVDNVCNRDDFTDKGTIQDLESFEVFLSVEKGSFNANSEAILN